MVIACIHFNFSRFYGKNAVLDWLNSLFQYKTTHPNSNAIPFTQNCITEDGAVQTFAVMPVARVQLAVVVIVLRQTSNLNSTASLVQVQVQQHPRRQLWKTCCCTLSRVEPMSNLPKMWIIERDNVRIASDQVWCENQFRFSLAGWIVITQAEKG